MGHTRDLWYTAGKRGPKRPTAKHPDRGGDKNANRYQAVWNEPDGSVATRTFAKKGSADSHWKAQETDVERGQYVDRKKAKVKVGAWCDTWLSGYSKRTSTVRQAKVHVVQIKKEFGPMTLLALAEQPSRISTWVAKLAASGYEASYVYALHSRLSQIMAAAVREKLIGVNPCSRFTSPGTGKQRPYVLTTEQLWQLHDAMPAYLKVSILMGALAGMRVGEASGSRPGDVDLAADVWNPAVQYPAENLKSETSRTPVPVPHSLTVELLAHFAQFPGDWILTTEDGGQVGPWRIERAIRTARKKVPGLPEGFRYQDLRHYLASFLIASGADVLKVKTRLRHASSKTTLDTYSHLWPDSDQSTRAALEAVFLARPQPADSKITEP